MSVVKLPLIAVDPVTGLPSGDDLSVDLNSTDSEVIFDVGPYDYFSIEGIPQTGTWDGTGVVTVYFSNNGFVGAAYKDALGSKGSTATFDGTTLGLNDQFCKGFRFAHAKVTTAQGAAATCAMNAWGSAEGAPGRAGRVAAGATGETTGGNGGGGGGGPNVTDTNIIGGETTSPRNPGGGGTFTP